MQYACFNSKRIQRDSVVSVCNTDRSLWLSRLALTFSAASDSMRGGLALVGVVWPEVWADPPCDGLLLSLLMVGPLPPPDTFSLVMVMVSEGTLISSPWPGVQCRVVKPLLDSWYIRLVVPMLDILLDESRLDRGVVSMLWLNVAGDCNAGKCLAVRSDEPTSRKCCYLFEVHTLSTISQF